ncbi:MAG: hypothetical protein JWN79_1367 [Gemmatimonadetes bacterium]|jgi:hypothetical protein|nr:hypothetical protein [Gemmatimonadota bacterium]
MPHLSADRLAELGDDAPTSAECAHLAECDACAREREAYVALVRLSHDEHDALALPLTRWERIAAELALDDAPAPPFDLAARRTTPRAAPRTTRWPMQVAAGLLLCAGGAVLGRMSAGAEMFPERSLAATGRTAAMAAASRLVSDSGSFASIDEARAAQQRSEMLYEQAAAFLAQHDSTMGVGSPVAYRSRLAALDQVISTTREALREAPHDPVINNYYLTTIGQREATLRQLNTALPASLRLNSF